MQVAWQINGRKRVLLLHLARMRYSQMPGQLCRLLTNCDIIKAGRQVGGDISRLRGMVRGGFKEQGVLELGSSCWRRVLVDNG